MIFHKKRLASPHTLDPVRLLAHGESARRALQLLSENLTVDEASHFNRTGCLHIKALFHEFAFMPQNQLYYRMRGQRKWRKYCMMPMQIVPWPDRLLSMVLAIKTNEWRYIRELNGMGRVPRGVAKRYGLPD